MRADEALKLFGLNNLVIESAIRRIEGEHSIDLGHKADKEQRIEETYYPQFAERLRMEHRACRITMQSFTAWKTAYVKY